MSPTPSTPSKDKGKSEKRKKTEVEGGGKEDNPAPTKQSRQEVKTKGSPASADSAKKTEVRKDIVRTTTAETKKLVQSKSIQDMKSREQKKVDVYQEVLKLELSESQERPREDDIELCKKTIAEIRDKIGKIHSMRLNGSKGSEFDQVRMEVGLLFVKMKKLNRLDKLRHRSARENTNSSKQKVDQFNLQLQNLRYEVLHLKKEVSRCINFWSADEDVDLVDVNQFYADAPRDVSKPEVTKDDPHQLRLARLVWELKTRKKLHAQANKLEEERNELESIVSGRDDKVKELGKHLNNMLNMTKPVQEILHLPMDEDRKRNRMLALLPLPLQNLAACADKLTADNKDNNLLSFDVEGEEKKAREWNGEREGEDEEGGAEHPLKVTLAVKTKAGDQMNLSFSLLTKCNLVSLKGKIKAKDPTYSGEVMEVSSILNSSNSEANSDSAEAQQFEAVVTEKLGKSREDLTIFSWVQKLAGLRMDGNSSPSISQTEKIELLSSVVRLIRERLEARVSLQQQLNLLATGKSLKQESWPAHIVHRYPLKLSSKLKSCESYTWEQFCQNAEHSSLLKEGVIDSNDFLYKCVITRGIATLTGLVAVKSDYPSTAPIFILTLAWKERWNSSNNEWMRDLESEVNTRVHQEDTSDKLFMHQVYRLIVLLDVMLECISAMDDQPVFSKQHNFQVPVDGRQRKIPFVYDQEEACFRARD